MNQELTKVEIMKDRGNEIVLGGKVFTVKFDLNALCEMQRQFGSMEKAFTSLSQGDFSKIRTLLHIALANGENEDIPLRTVGSLIDVKNMSQVVEVLEKTIVESMPEVEEGK